MCGRQCVWRPECRSAVRAPTPCWRRGPRAEVTNQDGISGKKKYGNYTQFGYGPTVLHDLAQQCRDWYSLFSII